MSATRRQPATNNPSRGVQKNDRPAPSRESHQSRALRSSSTPAIESIPLLEPLQEPLAASLSDPPQSKGRKRSHSSENEYPDKRLKENSQSLSEPSHPLSKANLRQHNRITDLGLLDNMDPAVAASPRGGQKRALSRQSSISDLNQEPSSIHSQRSSGTASFYRWIILMNANTFIRSGPLPQDIQDRVNAVIQREISEERRLELAYIAGKLCEDFLIVFDGSTREDDCVQPILAALRSMEKGKKLHFLEKADWDPNLKPITHRTSWNMSLLKKPTDESHDSVSRPRVQQQVDPANLTPGATEPSMPPPPPPKKPAIPLVKTPRPDITAGFHHSIVVEALNAQGLDPKAADDFLVQLQWEQMLCSDPTGQGTPIRFPPLVFEGKSYATGRTVFEAQNQAAVSGSCMTNLQHTLADLTERASPGSYRAKAPLAFSICTEGPHIELWVHYTAFKNGVRTYNMNILKTCHASLREGVEEFVKVLDSVLNWACVDFVRDVAEQVALMAKAVQE